MIDRILLATYNYNDASHRNQFRRVIADYAHEAVLQYIPSERTGGQVGYEVPIETDRAGTCIVAKKDDQNGNVTYWGDRKLFTLWNGKPAWYSTMD